jgi:NAD+ kinase
MQIAIFGRSFNESRAQVVKDLYSFLHAEGAELVILESFHKSTSAHLPKDAKVTTFKDASDLHSGISCMMTIGGDGTLLEAVTLIRDSGIPVLGINTGRLGFLAGYSQDEIQIAVQMAVHQEYTIDERALLQLDIDGSAFGEFPFALNDITLHKKESSTMITVHVGMDGTPLNSYWADGLIIASPTGSTGYSLSCGGPIILPESPNFVITPIAPHNLNVRPLVINDTHVLSVDVEVRGKNFMLALDSRSVSLPARSRITVKKAPFKIRLARKPDQSFLKTLREKLMWGIDRRN